MRSTIVAVLFATCVFAAEAHAEIFKCKEPDGTLTFSQTPCSTEPPVTVKTSAGDTSEINCSYANKFAFATARTMQSGVPSDEIFNRYGGLDSLSKGSIGVINYVYSFRTNDEVSAERIAGLSQAKCKARSFGDVSCEVLPLSFTETLGGCNAEAVEETTEGQPAQVATTMSALNERTLTESTSARAPQRPATGTIDKESVERCKKKYRDQIDAIDAQMRSGYTSEQGEAYRERLRGLTEKLRAC